MEGEKKMEKANNGINGNENDREGNRKGRLLKA